MSKCRKYRSNSTPKSFSCLSSLTGVRGTARHHERRRRHQRQAAVRLQVRRLWRRGLGLGLLGLLLGDGQAVGGGGAGAGGGRAARRGRVLQAQLGRLSRDLEVEEKMYFFNSLM